MPETKTRAEWVAMIRQAHDEFVDGFFKLGDTLIAAKVALRRGTFLKMIETDLPFTARWAQKLMEVAADQRIRKASQGSLLPMAVTTLYELHRLTDDAFERALASGEINPDMTRAEATRLVKFNVIQEERRVVVPYYRHAEEPEPRVASGRRGYIMVDDPDETETPRLVHSARPKPAAAISEVTPLALLQINRLADNLADAIKRGDVEKATVLERWRAAEARLSSVEQNPTIN